MADETRVAAGKRFSRDMRLIREDRGTSIDAVHSETRIARSLIESFEQGGLYDHPTFNEVYLRSFVRAYAEAVDISADAALAGLEAALKGGYENALAEQYLDSSARKPEKSSREEEEEGEPADDRSTSEPSSPEDESPPSATPAAGGPEGRGGIVGPPRAVGDSPGTDEPSDEPDGASGAGSPQEPSDGEEAPPESEGPTEPTNGENASAAGGSSDGEGRSAGSQRTDSPASDSGEEGPAWMEGEPEDGGEPSTGHATPEPGPPEEGEGLPAGDMGDTGIVGEPTAMGEEGEREPPPEPARPSDAPDGEGRRPRRGSAWGRLFSGEQREMVWAAVGIVVILLVMAGLGFAYFSAGERSSPEPSPAAVAPDTTTSEPDTVTTTPSRPPRANVRLGDTMHLTVVATSDVSEVRIQRDQDLRRPYWIQEGEASVFPFEQRVTLENELTDFRLLLEGYPYPHSADDPDGEIVITRDGAEAFVDTLRGSPTSLSVTPDTLPVGVPEQ